MKNIREERILILDFGSQVTALIARRIREIGIYCEILPYDINTNDIQNFGAKGIILSGGPESVHLENSPKINPAVFQLRVPVLGICYGMQAMAAHFGGKVEAGGVENREFGYAEVDFDKNSSLFQGIDIRKVWMSHGDFVSVLPENFSVIGKSQNAPIAAFENKEKNLYGVQFHPEVSHTENGTEMLRNFAVKICAINPCWNSSNFIEDAVAKIKAQIGEKEKVLLALSGGVDSSVAAVLLHRAIGERLVCVFVDTGLLRLNEGDDLMKIFAENLGINVIRVNAQDRYFQKLAGVTDPEDKRKIIGAEFIKIFEEEARKLGDIKWLAQGTIYPDVIESAAAKSGKAKVIKSHHNVGGLPADMNLKLVEPLRDLFKDEVRKVGVELGLAAKMLYRHPFPGPGLGVRILGEVKAEYAELLRRADDIFIRALYRADLYDKVSQAFAVFLPVKSVGVMGDGRRYDFVVALRAVETIDFMTARWANLPYDFLDEVSREIINSVEGISRVVYDISGKPPATIEWE
ncbi:MAG: glutamine-hydrolyzing GMP synthase [Cardiobacteriaceae bacterium]|nr:glutamine-hydrolyzing GMP synthase [Cardiobacteriaceae bacterium]